MVGLKVQQIVLFMSDKMNFRIIHLLLLSATPQAEKELHSPTVALTVTEPLCHGFGILATATPAPIKIPVIGIASTEPIRLRLLLPMMTEIEIPNRKLQLSQLKKSDGGDGDKDILK